MTPGTLISDSQSFDRLREECAEVFLTDNRLPYNVFRRRFPHLYAFEYHPILRQDFATFLTQLAGICGDRRVNYLSLEPDAVDYYYKYCGFYGLASFDPVTLADNYLDVMYRDGNADSFRTRGGDVCVLWGSSLKWGIWGDRKSWELCVMASAEPLPANIHSFRFMGADVLRNYELGLYASKPEVGRKFLSELTRQYPALFETTFP